MATTAGRASSFTVASVRLSCGLRRDGVLLAAGRRLEEAKAALKAGAEELPLGDPDDPATVIQPMVSAAHYERVQGHIRKGIEEGAEVLTGGEGKPEGYEAGNYVKPTVFVGVTNDMSIAREERLPHANWRRPASWWASQPAARTVSKR